jgi:error-prone DNA polymerase
MPEIPSKLRQHPAKTVSQPASGVVARPPRASVEYAELAVTSNFTFLTGASHPDELVSQAAAMGLAAIAITDTNTLAGVVRAHVAAKDAGIPFVLGCRLRFDEPMPLDVLVYPTDLRSYGRLCRLLTTGMMRAPKGQCHLALHDFLESNEGLLAIVMPPPALDQDFIYVLERMRRVLDDDRLSLGAQCLYKDDDRGWLDRLAFLSRQTHVPLVATNDVHYHVPQRRLLQDVLTCIREGCTIGQAGLRLLANAERHIKAPQEMARLFTAYPGAIARTMEIARRALGIRRGDTETRRRGDATSAPTSLSSIRNASAGFNLDQLRYQYPNELCPPGVSPMEHLRRLTFEGSVQRYPGGLPPTVRLQIEHELELIAELNYAPYFLTVHDLVQFARSRNILCQGRGAAANSAVCFCLGVTSVDPSRIDVLFERFVSRERNEPPDIDIDFEHERREEVLQYIYTKYGRHRAALTAEVITYRGRLAVREVGKALGLPDDCIDRLAKGQDWWDEKPLGPEVLAGAGLNVQALGTPGGDRTVAALVWLTNELIGFPRHLSQHVGGFVITQDPLCELVPIENAAMPDRTIIQWDKDDIDALGMLKVDCLGLGMLTCIKKAMALVGEQFRRQHGREISLATIPAEDSRVYDMICEADTVGVFQIESRAQMSMLPRLRPRCFYDLVIEVAIVRPGPIVGDMVHPYLRRRQGIEPVVYPDEKVRAVLGKTLGVPLFQEQAMKLAMVAGGFSPGQADQLRRAIASKRSRAKLEEIGRRLISGMIANGYGDAFAQKCFQQFQGFSEYGFPESHAASFALLVYASAWLKRHYPAAFAAALLNSQPMGFYAPAQIIADAQHRGVEVLAVDVNHSGWDCRLENCGLPLDSARGPEHVEGRIADCGLQSSIRLGMRMVKGLSQTQGLAIENAVIEHGRFSDIESLWRASGVMVATLRHLAAADAFASMNLNRQAAMWQILALGEKDMPLFGAAAVSRGTGVPPVSSSAYCGREEGEETPFGSEPQGRRHGQDAHATETHGRDAHATAACATFDLLPPMTPLQQVIQDYKHTGLSLKRHPIAFLRPMLLERNICTTEQVRDAGGKPHGSRAAVAGMVLVRQRPSSAAGVIFVTIEDETGCANIMIRPSVLPRCKKALAGAILVFSGKVERVGQVVHVLAEAVEDISSQLEALAVQGRNYR